MAEAPQCVCSRTNVDSKGELISSSLLLHSEVVKLISLTKWLAEEKEISSATDAKLIMLLEPSLITSSFRPHKTAESCIAQGKQGGPLRDALLRQQIGLRHQ